MLGCILSDDDANVRFHGTIQVADQSGRQVGQLQVETLVQWTIGFMKAGELETFSMLYAVGAKDLSWRIVRELRRHPHWFEAAR